MNSPRSYRHAVFKGEHNLGPEPNHDEPFFCLLVEVPFLKVMVNIEHHMKHWFFLKRVSNGMINKMPNHATQR